MKPLQEIIWGIEYDVEEHDELVESLWQRGPMFGMCSGGPRCGLNSACNSGFPVALCDIGFICG
ncbi:MAG: hypothetical protein FWE05_09150 [Defluviitaleaceae bacterium]|nr:hypothetical protein [Defluviitaleaceae bacterium]